MGKKRSCSTKKKRQLECDKLPWPGLRAKDRLTRVVTRFVKQLREEEELKMRQKGSIVRPTKT
jgi:hypothetical protein